MNFFKIIIFIITSIYGCSCLASIKLNRDNLRNTKLSNIRFSWFHQKYKLWSAFESLTNSYDVEYYGNITIGIINIYNLKIIGIVKKIIYF